MTREQKNAQPRLGFLTTAFAATVLVACGAAVAPEPLLTAREAVTKAQEGKSAELAPVQLEEAKQALAEADKAFSDGEDDDVIQDLAYIAQRRAALAVSTAGFEGAKRDQEGTDKAGRNLQEEFVESAEKKIEKTKEQLEQEKLKGQQAQAEVQRTKVELEKERTARLAVEKKLSLALSSLSEVAQVKEEQRGVVITLTGSVLFATGKYKLLPIAKDRLDDVAKALLDQGFKSLVVEGHTDSKGPASANLDLSQSRAEEVRGYLVQRGIPSNKITAVGKGEERPVADNTTADGQANNRRVEIIVSPE